MTTHPLELIPVASAPIEYLSPNDAARRLGIDPSTLYRHYGAAMRSGQIHTLKIGAARRILWSSLLSYIQAATPEVTYART